MRLHRFINPGMVIIPAFVSKVDDEVVKKFAQLFEVQTIATIDANEMQTSIAFSS